MRRFSRSWVIYYAAAAMLGTFWATSVQGAISFYRGGKTLGYSQTSDSQPTTPNVIYGGMDLYATIPIDLLSARVFSTSPTNLSPASPFVLTQYAPGGWISQQTYPSVEAMDVALPKGDVFGFLIEGGVLGSRLGLLPAPLNNLFSPSVPYFTNNAFSQLNGMNPAAPFALAWNGYVPLAGITDAPTFLNIYRVLDGQSMIGATLSSTTGSFLIPANTLAPGTTYKASLGFSDRIVKIDAGFIDGDSTYSFDRATDLQFITGPAASATQSIAEPASVGLSLAALVVVFGFRSRIRNCRFYGPLAIVVIMLLASNSYATIDFYRIGKTIVHQQTSASQPTTPSSVYGGVDMAASSPDDLTSARVFSTTTTPPSPVPEFVLTQFSPGYWGSSQTYASLAAMDTNLPPGDTFGFLIEGGVLGSQLALLSIPATDLFSPSVPYFTGSTFAQLNGLNTAAPLTVTWNGYSPAAGINDSLIYFNIYRVSDGQQATGTTVSPSITSFQVPANTLLPNTQYKAILDYSSRKNTTDAGFIVADASTLYDSVTELTFMTGAGPVTGDYNHNGVVDAADYVLWRDTLTQTGPNLPADGDGSGTIDAGDYTVWKANFGKTSGAGSGMDGGGVAVPEPGAVVLCGICLATLAVSSRRGGYVRAK